MSTVLRDTMGLHCDVFAPQEHERLSAQLQRSALEWELREAFYREVHARRTRAARGIAFSLDCALRCKTL